MSVRRRAAKRDANERPIIDALKAVGASVLQVSESGAMDLVVGFRGVTHVMEVKGEGEGLTEDQEKFHSGWVGSRISIVFTPSDALRAIGVETAERRPWTDEERAELLPAPRRKR